MGLPRARRVNAVLEDAVRAYLELFCADTQPQELHALRTLAQVDAASWSFMNRRCGARPRAYPDVICNCFAMTPKPLKLPCWIGKCAEVSQVPDFKGALVDALSIHSWCAPWAKRWGYTC